MPLTMPRSVVAAATMASPGCAPTTAQTIMRPLLSIPTAIGLKPIATRRADLATGLAGCPLPALSRLGGGRRGPGERNMASISKEISTAAPAADAGGALRDVGALHTRLVPGFVTDTRLEPGARIVTFGNGMTARELIVTIDDDERRIVWSVVHGSLTHHNGSAQVLADAKGLTKVVWIA